MSHVVVGTSQLHKRLWADFRLRKLWVSPSLGLTLWFAIYEIPKFQGGGTSSFWYQTKWHAMVYWPTKRKAWNSPGKIPWCKWCFSINSPSPPRFDPISDRASLTSSSVARRMMRKSSKPSACASIRHRIARQLSPYHSWFEVSMYTVLCVACSPVLYVHKWVDSPTWISANVQMLCIKFTLPFPWLEVVKVAYGATWSWMRF